MKLIVRLILLLLAVIALLQCKKEESEPEHEPEPEPKEFKIVDGNFLNDLIARGFDVDSNRIIDSAEALAIEYLYIDNCNISNLEGIQNFTNLKLLSCKGNNLASLVVYEI